MPRRHAYEMLKSLPHIFVLCSFVFHLNAKTQPQMKELSKCANLDYMYNDYHRTHAAYSLIFRFFLRRPVESNSFIQKMIEDDVDKRKCLQMAAEDLQNSFAETNDFLGIQPSTLQLKHKHYISPLIVMLPRKIVPI